MRLQKKKFALFFLIAAFVATLFYVNPTSSAEIKTVVSFYPRIPYGVVNSTFLVNITVADVLSLYAWQVNMSYNKDVLEFVNVTEGDFLERQPEGSFQAGLDKGDDWAFFGWTTYGEYVGEDGSGTLATIEFKVIGEGESPITFLGVGKNATAQTSLLAQTAPVAPPYWYYPAFIAEDGVFTNEITPSVPYFTYSLPYPGVNQTVEFNASKSTPAPSLEITEYFWDFGDNTTDSSSIPTITHVYAASGKYNVSLTIFDNATASPLIKSTFNLTDDAMPRQWYEAHCTYTREINLAAVHDVEVTRVTASKREVVAGETVSINVTVSNNGIVEEDFDVTAYFDTNEIDTRAVSLDSFDETSIVFDWDTAGVAEGEYQIKAVASGVEGDENPDNNEFLDGTVTVKAGSQFPTILIIGGAAGVGIVVVLIVVFFMRRKRASSPT